MGPTRNVYEYKNHCSDHRLLFWLRQSERHKLLARGWNVIATMRSPKTGLFEDSNRLLTTSLDVTSPKSISDAISEGIAQFGKIDVVVNNAGIGMFGAHEVVTDEVIWQVFGTNTFGVMAVNRAIASHA
jgi:NAD(P)-dependent dehydrogenase (short-subunit alcohol dehydrogenase family)